MPYHLEMLKIFSPFWFQFVYLISSHKIGFALLFSTQFFDIITDNEYVVTSAFKNKTSIRYLNNDCQTF